MKSPSGRAEGSAGVLGRRDVSIGRERRYQKVRVPTAFTKKQKQGKAKIWEGGGQKMAGVKKNSEIRKDSARQCSPGKKLSFSSSSSFPSCSDPSSFFKIMLGNFRDFLVCLLFSYFVAFFFLVHTFYILIENVPYLCLSSFWDQDLASL